MKYCTVCKAKYEDGVSFCPIDGEVLEADPASIVDTVLDGQYQIESMLGKGGMGAVYRARHILLGDRVAIKVLPPEVRTNAEWLRRFRREGQAARRFRHPNAVTVYDLRTAGDGTIYMVMEYVEGHTLDAEIKARGRFTPAQAVTVLEPIMSVLNTAHEMGVVHRDLKPENIMIGQATTGGEPVVKLLDLGIAKMREIAGDSGGTTALTMAGQVLGTPYYMSPEQWGELPRDGNPEIDGRADIYSLGLVVYEMIAGRRPHAGMTLSELRREHVSSTLRPLHELFPEVPAEFSAAIGRAVAKDRADRQSTAGEVAAQLRASVGTGQSGEAGRILPDLFRVGSTSTQTVGIAEAALTRSDVNAPTILTVDASPPTTPAIAAVRPTSAPVAQPPAFEPNSTTAAPQRFAAAGALAETQAAVSGSALPQTAQAELAPPQPARRGPFILVGAGVLVAVLIILGVGGFFALKWLKTPPSSTGNGTTTRPASAAGGAGAETASTTPEAGRYWLELLPTDLLSESTRVAGVVPLASGQPFKFHFQFNDNGYLYIIGPGKQNQATAFLTSKPAGISGLVSNQVAKGDDFSFPNGVEHWLELDKKPGTEDYTIVFSPQPLSYPGFFQDQVTGEPLNDVEQAELRAFLPKYEASKPLTEVNDKNPGEPFVLVKLPKTAVDGNPIIFGIRIQHK